MNKRNKFEPISSLIALAGYSKNFLLSSYDENLEGGALASKIQPKIV
jgi:hypothetical protein